MRMFGIRLGFLGVWRRIMDHRVDHCFKCDRLIREGETCCKEEDHVDSSTSILWGVLIGLILVVLWEIR